MNICWTPPKCGAIMAPMDIHDNVAGLDRINLRLSHATFQAIDQARAARPGRISRNTWIAEAIEAKLAEEEALSERTQNAAANNA